MSGTAVRVEAGSPRAPHSRALIAELDEYLMGLYPPETNYLLDVEALAAPEVRFFLAYLDHQTAGCAALRRLDAQSGEVKRMYVRPEFRGREYGKLLIDHLAAHAKSHGITLLRLETGIHQLAAIRLYEQYGFRQIPPFAPYFENPVSRCYEMSLA